MSKGEIVLEQLRPHLVIQAPKAAEAIAFYAKAFGAQEVARSVHHKHKPDPLILHSHLKCGNVEFMVCDETEEAGPSVKSPASLKGTTCILHLMANDVDAAFNRAVAAGCKVLEGVADQSWGQRYGKLLDPYGFAWSIATPIRST